MLVTLCGRGTQAVGTGRGAEEFKRAVFDRLAVADVAAVFVFFVDEGGWLVSGAAPACAG